MVDAAAPVDAGNRPAGPSAFPPGGPPPVARIHLTARDAIAAYRAACDGAVSPAQGFAWISTWVAHTRPDFLVASLAGESGNLFALALEVTQSGPFRVARFMGGRHANGNFPPVAPARMARADIDAVVTAVKRARPDIDMLAFERLADRLDGLENPLLLLPHAPSANLSLAIDLKGGFDELLTRVSGRRKRKKHRAQARKFEAAGGYRRIQAKTPAETNALLDAFFVMKDERFRKMGISNVFGDPAVQSFFRALFSDALADKEPAFLLHGLEVDGKLRAVTGSSRAGKRLVCEFGSIADDDLSHTSPGDFLFFENIREACETGFDVYDFSVGDEPYKRLWCDIETVHFDAFVPLTAKGRLLSGGMRATNRLKSLVKGSPAVWRIAKALRRRSGAQVAPAED